ncbi:transmembrane protein, putative (macronuclear) [Tetrahymena thermophila SB210]|uniref:Transmembrane protein, putative n=1 Tax=Tetrahymena thermophila (strain SB210) TaxID=312017 RepID=Q22LN8_TETTS|nr:transmembrane protein, putative [Tetrahymena thermophila SB210]EAR86228.2 transmembrane protein, putative [Tetrahymena thermophila SB210]|eukprot:XP_976823.2 transmembrane protein, putative [Tetrahymena thermophila SB210]
MNISDSQKRKPSSLNVSKSIHDVSISVSQKKSKDINIGDQVEIQLEKSLKKNSDEQMNIFQKRKSNLQFNQPFQSENQKKLVQENEIMLKGQDQNIEIDIENEYPKDEIKEEKDDDKNQIAKFYEQENDSNNDKIYIYFLIYMFNLVMMVFLCNEYNQNQLNRYLIAQIFFIILERIGKFILFSSLDLPQLLVWNGLFLDYVAIINYENQRKLKRNYNLYNVIVKRIDIIIASKFIESTVLSGPSLLLVISACVQDTVSTIYILSAISSLANLILANKELMEFQIIQCKFNSLTNEIRNRFFQTYANHIKDLTTILINIGAQAGLWMVCTQINNFILMHAFLSFVYIAAITFTVVYKSFQREKKLALQEKSQIDIRTITAMIGLGLSFTVFVLFYCVFFFLKLKKVLYSYLIENSTSQQKKFTEYIEFLQQSSESIKQMKPPSENLIFADYKFYQFSLAFKALAFYRAYSICNTIILLALDIKNNIQNGQYMLIRIVAYICSIIIFFHLFLMKRDYFLYKQIKNEKYQGIILTRILKKSKIPYNILIELKEDNKILPPNLISQNVSQQKDQIVNELKEEQIEIPQVVQQEIKNKEDEDVQQEPQIKQPTNMQYNIFNKLKKNQKQDDIQL